MRVSKFCVYVVVLSFVSSGFAACPSLLPNWRFWKYSPVNIKDQSAYPDSIFIQAEANWESLGLNIHICRTFSTPQCIYHDVTVTDDTSIAPDLGLAFVEPPPQECLNKKDNCGVCF